MKNARKLTSILVLIAMLFMIAAPAMAAEGETPTITIDNAVVGQTYTIYKILDLEHNADYSAVKYKAASGWENFINSAEIKDVYVDVDADGYVTWHSTPNEEGQAVAADAAEFAKLAQAYAKKNDMTNQGTTKANSTTVTFSGLELGYYLMDSTLGVLCSLDTAKPTVTIKEKNGEPTIEKKVQEDSKIGETDEWGDTNDADINQVVNFKTTVHAEKGAQNYVVHDKMSEGLTFGGANTVTIKVGDTELIKKDDAHSTGYQYEVVTSNLENTDPCDFHIVFDQTYLDTITDATDIVITYSATLNENAVIAGDGNPNDTMLDYGDNSHTEWDETITYTYKFDLVKTDSSNKVITGAEFKLYNALTDGQEIPLVKESEGVYRVATDTEKNVEGFTSATIEVGQAIIKGLDGTTTYYLEETKAPDGYNQLTARQEVTLQKNNLEATVETDTWIEGGAHVINQSGATLPETGGIGTTIFYVVGAALVVGAGVLLVTKKRMTGQR